MAVGPGLTTVTGAAARPRHWESGETCAGAAAPSSLLKPGKVQSDLPLQVVEGRRSSGTSLGWEVRGRCRLGGGEKTENQEQEG